MSRRNGIMSDGLKMEIAKELGFFSPEVSQGDFGNVTARNCGNMVKSAIQIAEKSMLGK